VTNTRRELEGLNYLLHGATVLGLELDPSNHVATISLQITTAPKAGPVPVRSTLRLMPVSALVVTVETLEGTPPTKGMAPIPLDRLSQLASEHHPLTGFDFIDSERSSEPRGSLVFEWFEPGVPSRHTLNFYYGMQSAEDESALLFFRIFFDTAGLTYPSGQAISIDAFVPSDDSVGRALAFGSETGPEAPIKVLPDPVSPSSVDGELLALVFVDLELAIRGHAVGMARWDGHRMGWVSPEGVLYDLPDTSAKAIRPRFPEISMGPKRLDGFAYFLLLPIPIHGANLREWVTKNLKPNRRWRSFLDRRK
jgi:hypothetical protein